MKEEYKVGEKIILEVQECNTCEGCFFDNQGTCYVPPDFVCSSNEREDKKSVIFIEKKEKKNGE